MCWPRTGTAPRRTKHGSTYSRLGSPLDFPLSDLSRSKLRPAVVLADAERGDWVLCQVTSNAYGDPRAVVLTAADFASGGLRLTSYARPAKLFTAHESIFTSEVGILLPAARQRIVSAVMVVLR